MWIGGSPVTKMIYKTDERLVTSQTELCLSRKFHFVTRRKSVLKIGFVIRLLPIPPNFLHFMLFRRESEGFLGIGCAQPEGAARYPAKCMGESDFYDNVIISFL